MADKFFFKGRQETRENHVKYGYATKANSKAGTKKYPLSLTVTNNVRKQEVEAIVKEAKLHAIVHLDQREGAVESLTELNAVLNKKGTLVLDKVPARNEPCHCGSTKKYKKCCA